MFSFVLVCYFTVPNSRLLACFCHASRNEELTRLQMKDIELGLTTDTGSPFFTITLTFRKTNQADVSKGKKLFVLLSFLLCAAQPRSRADNAHTFTIFTYPFFPLANIYQIHPQPDYEAICCYTKLKAWLQWMERSGRRLHPEDYVFPALDAQGRIKFQEALSQTRVQGWLDRLTNQTGLLARRNGRFTTHCFRRGGAQFRFMFAKEKWSLKAVKWWGGWSEGEGTGTIMRYLLEEFTRYEYGFSDMLSPSRQDSRHAVFMGETDTPGATPITQYSLDVSLQSLKEAINVEMNHRSSIQEQELNHKQEVANKALIDSNNAVMASNMALQESFLAAIQGLGVAQRQQGLQGQQVHQQHEPAPAPAAIPVLPILPAPVPVPVPAPTPAREQPQQGDVDPPPAPRIPTIKLWKDAVKQWEVGDPAKGLTIPLRDWTGAMRKTDPTKYSQRKLIAKEFDRVGRNEGNMDDIHGEHAKSVRYLIESIRWGNSRRKAEAANKRVATTGGALDENEDVDDIEVDEGDDSEEMEEEESEEECLIRRKLPTPVLPSANQVAPKPFKARVVVPRVTRSQSVAPALVQAAPNHCTPFKRRLRSMSVCHTRAKRR